MFSQFSSLAIPKFGFGRSTTKGGIALPSVEVYNIETQVDKRGRALKHLIKLNHTNFSILYNELRFHNHTPHILGSVFLFGGSADHLNDTYEHFATHEGLEPWTDSPSEIALHDYRDFLGLREYQRAWVDFFEDQLVVTGSYEWRNVVMKFLFESGPKKEPNRYPIIHSIVAGLGHPLIHLGYAFELDSRDIAMEAMGLAATCYDAQLATLLESTINNAPTSLVYATSNLFEILARVNADKRLDDKFGQHERGNLSQIFQDKVLTSILMEHVSAWKVTDPKKQFEESQQLVTTLLISSAQSVGGHGYDFFLVHLLTTSHAIRIILPEIESQYHVLLVREWWLITVAIYIAQLRPVVKREYVEKVDLNGRSWQTITDLALVGKHKFDEHYVKALRAMKAAAATWGDENSYYLKAAVKFGTEFTEWGGFDPQETSERAEKEGKWRPGSPM